MKFRNYVAVSAFLVITLGLSTAANAALVSVLSGAGIYDEDIGVTWLTDANLASSNTFEVSGINLDGSMSWTTAQSWIDAMNTANYLGYHDWRLPTTLQPDATCEYQFPTSYGLDCTGSELGHLFYSELGGVRNTSIADTHNINYNLFSNIQANYYWSGTEYVSGSSAWDFGFGYGGQYVNDLSSNYFVLALRSSDVVVPVPAAFWLFGSGLIGLFGFMRRRKLSN
jgi:hypothetical protein